MPHQHQGQDGNNILLLATMLWLSANQSLTELSFNMIINSTMDINDIVSKFSSGDAQCMKGYGYAKNSICQKNELHGYGSEPSIYSLILLIHYALVYHWYAPHIIHASYS